MFITFSRTKGNKSYTLFMDSRDNNSQKYFSNTKENILISIFLEYKNNGTHKYFLRKTGSLTLTSTPRTQLL